MKVCHRTTSIVTSRVQTEKSTITTDYPDVFPILKFGKNTSLRQRLYEQFDDRAYPKNRDLLMKMMQTRYEIATLLGYSSWADYNAADKMAANGKNIANFIQDLAAATRPLAEREFALLLAEKRKSEPEAKEIWEYEAGYLREQLRRSQYNFDSQSVRPYLPYNSVKKGIDGYGCAVVPRDISAGTECAGMGPDRRNLGCSGSGENDWALLS